MSMFSSLRALIAIPFHGVTKGYWMGGKNSGGNSVTQIDGIDFPTESAIDPAAGLSLARSSCAPASGAINGISMGGITTSTNRSNEIDGINFPTETQYDPSATMASLVNVAAGLSSTSTKKGYRLGGNISSTTVTTEIQGFNFDTEASINPSATVAAARSNWSGIYNRAKGFAGGGFLIPAFRDDIYGFTFSDETSFNPVLTMAGGDVSGAGSWSVLQYDKGYWMGGVNGGIRSSINGMNIGAETTINPSATLSVARNLLHNSGCQSAFAGYVGGGLTGSVSSEIDGMIFATETANDPSATLATARSTANGVQEWPQI